MLKTRGERGCAKKHSRLTRQHIISLSVLLTLVFRIHSGVDNKEKKVLFGLEVYDLFPDAFHVVSIHHDTGSNPPPLPRQF